MRHSRTKLDGHLLGSAVLPALAGALLLFIATGLWADPPDSTRLALREGLFVPRDTTRRAPPPVSRRALERLNRNSSKKWNVQWDRITGLPGIGGGVTKKKYAGEPADIASGFVEDYKDLFLGIDDPKLLRSYTFNVTRTKKNQGRTSIRLQTLYKGVNIHGGFTAFIFDAEGGVDHVNNYLKPIQLDDVTPLLTKAEIEEMISRAAAPRRVLKPSQIGEVFPHQETVESIGEKYDDLELVIYPSSPPRLAYVGRRIIGDLPFWRLIIDANTGEFISARALQYVTPRVSPPRQSVPDSTKQRAGEGVRALKDTTTRQPSLTSQAALERLNQNSVKKWWIQWDKSTGLPRTMTGETKSRYSGDLSKAAVSFVEEYLDLLTGISDPQSVSDFSFEVTRTRTNKAGTSKRVQGFYKAVKVVGWETCPVFSENGNVIRLQNYLKPIDFDNVTPSLTEDEAEQIIGELATPTFRDGNVEELELLILLSPPRLAYSGFRNVDYERWHYVIDAHTGEVISAKVWGLLEGFPGPRPDSTPSLSPPPADSSGVRGQPQNRPSPVLPAPERDIPDSLLKPDTTRLSPPLDDKVRREGNINYRKIDKQIPDRADIALERLNRNSSNRWRIRWNEKTGLPREIRGMTKKKYSGNPTEAALLFLGEFRDFFTGERDQEERDSYSFKVIDSKSFNIFTLVSIDSYYKGIKVLNGSLGVQVGNDGKIHGVHSNLDAINLGNVTPSLTEGEVERIISGMATPTLRDGNVEELELCILLSPPRLAYSGFRNVDYERWYYVIDAHTGEVISAKVWGLLEGFPGPRPDSTPSLPPPDCPGVPGLPQNKPFPVFPAPEREIPDSLLKPDTMRLSPPPDDKVLREGNINYRKIDKRIPDRADMLNPQSCCMFWEGNIEFEPESFNDADGDGYMRSAYVQWDADTYEDSSFVQKDRR